MTSKKLLLILSFVIFTCFNLFADDLVIIESPSSIEKCAGESGELKINIEGGVGQINFQWEKSDDREGPYSNIGPNSNLMEFTSLTASDNGFYRCIVIDESGTVLTSDPAHITVVAAAPNILGISSTQPFLCEDGTNTITVQMETLENVFTEWFFNNNSLNRYGPSYSIYGAGQQNAGDYYLVASNACGIVTSTTISLEFKNKPAINTQIQPTIACEGEDMTLTANATGSDLQFVWLKDNTPIPGETGNSYTIHDITYPQPDMYKMVAYNQCSSDTSLGVFLTVKKFPEVTGNPLDTSVCIGTDVTFHAYANSNADDPCIYQWYNDNGLIADETETSLDVTVISGMANNYYCMITNSCGTVSTDTAGILFKTPPEFTEQPDDVTICVGDDLELQVKVVGTTPINYQWLRNNVNVYGQNIYGENTSLMGITSAVISQSGFYHCHASNSCGSVTSDSAQVIINDPIAIIEDIDDGDYCEGTELSMSPRITGTGPISYSWHITGSSNPLGTESIFIIESLTGSDSGEYYCILSNGCGDLSTDTVDIQVKELPRITTEPTGLEICTGDNIELRVEATGYSPLSYIWYRNGSVESGQMSNVLSYTNAGINRSGNYYCKVSNECGNAESDSALVLVGTPPSVVIQPRDLSICELDTIRLYTSIYGDNFHLQWYFNGYQISGQNDTVLTIPMANMGNNGSYYCSAYNSCEAVHTNTVNVTINPAPSLHLGSDIEECEGTPVTLAAEEDPGNFISFNWNNGQATSTTFEVESSGTYILEVMGSNYCKNRDTINVTLHPHYNLNLGDDEITACKESIILNAGNGAYSYIWSNGQTTSSITVTQSGTYSVTTTGSSFGCETKDSVQVNLYEPVIFSLGEDRSVPKSSYVNLGIDPIYSEYLWNTGETTSSIIVEGSNYTYGSHGFWLKATSENGCYHADTIIITFFNDGSSIETNDVQDISLYPNPAKDYINILNENGIISEITIYDTYGKEILNKKIKNDNFTLDVTNFALGMYNVKIITDKNDVYIKSLIKQ